MDHKNRQKPGLEAGEGQERHESSPVFDKPLSEEEQVPVSIPYGEYNHYKMVCQPCGYECYINDRLVQKKTHVLHPLINALAVQDKEKYI